MGLSSSSLGCTGGTEDSSNHDGNDNGNAFHGSLFVKPRGSNASKNNNLAKNKPNGGKLLPYAAAVDSDTIMANLSNHFTLSSRRSHKEFAYGTKHRLSSLQMGVNCRDFDQYHLIAQGGFGAVVRAQRKATGRWYALKVQPMETMARASRSRARKIEDETALHMERTVLATCRGHPFIVSLEYAFHTQRYAVLAMECVEGGTLSQLILASPAMMLPFDLAKTYTMEIALGINFMHSRGIIYRDLKPSNILIDRHGHVKLTDFGLSGSLVKRASNRRQALLDDISNKQDVYSDNDAQDPSRSLPLSPSLIQSAHMLRDIRESTRSTEHISESSEDPEISDQDETAYVAHVRRLAGRDGSDENDLRRVRRRTVCGTAGYRPPEQLQERYTHYSSRTGYDERADWFALGVCCYAMVTGKRAFPTMRELRRSERSISARNGSRSGSGEATPRVGNLSREASKKVMNDAEFRCLLFEVQYPVQFCAERDAESFVRGLLELDPQSRLTYDGIMNHPWMKGEDFSNEGALQRPIPQWVKDHVYAQAKEVAKKENRWPQWKRLLRPRQYKSDRYNTLRECIDDMCKECYTTHDSSYAKTFGKKWTANARKSTIELFEHWAFLSEDAIAVEMNCASRGTRR